MSEITITTVDVPPFIRRSIKSMLNIVLRDYFMLHGNTVEIANKDRVLKDALSGKVTKETWCLLYMAYRVAEKSRLKTETITPLREALLEYVIRNKSSGTKEFLSFLAEREIVLRERNVRLTVSHLHDPQWHVDRFSPAGVRKRW